MKPVAVSVETPRPAQEVYSFLEALSNHEGFLDHLLVDWSYSGPKRGLGARASARMNVPGSQDWTDFEIIEVAPPGRIVEEGASAGGKRRTRGTYRLDELPEGGTKISFELEWLQVPKFERLAPPLVRAFTRRANGKAMRRLAKQLQTQA